MTKAKAKATEILCNNNVPVDHLGEAQHLIAWAKFANTASVRNQEVWTLLQDVYGRSKLEDIKRFILIVADQFKEHQPVVLFSISKVMGQDELYNAISIIGIEIATKKFEKYAEEKDQLLESREAAVLQKEIEVYHLNDDLKEELIEVKDRLVQLLSNKEIMEESYATLKETHEHSVDDYQALVKKLETFQPDAIKWRSMKKLVQDLAGNEEVDV